MPRTLKLLLAGYLLLDPIYLWQSGIPQLSDIVLLFLISWTFISTSPYDPTPSRLHMPLALLVAFVYYALLVNLTWSLVHPGTSSFVMGSIYLLFNVAVALTFVRLYLRYRRQLSAFLYNTLSSVLIIQGLSALVLMGSQGLRTMIFFNNPNQLGYYAVLTVVLITLLNFDAKRRPGLHVTNLLICVLLATASLSRAAIVPVIIIVLFNLIFEPNGWKLRLRFQTSMIAYSITIFGLAVLVFRDQLYSLVTSFQARLDSKGIIGGNEVSVRGYDRIIDHPQYWVFGAGNGAVERFDAVGEIHSTFGQLFFSYGLLGTALFAGAIFIIMKRNPASTIMLVSIFVYGLSHNGIRDGNLWIFLALALAVTSTRAGNVGHGQTPETHIPKALR